MALYDGLDMVPCEEVRVDRGRPGAQPERARARAFGTLGQDLVHGGAYRLPDVGRELVCEQHRWLLEMMVDGGQVVRIAGGGRNAEVVCAVGALSRSTPSLDSRPVW